MEQISQVQNNLHTREECPLCHFVFVAGYDPKGARNCPSCKQRYVAGQKPNHGSSCSVCANRNRGSNNVYYADGCPALMSDGRFITYHNSTNELTEAMRKLNGFTSPNEFRRFMQNNGRRFMDAERDYVVKANTCSPNTSCSEGWCKLWEKDRGSWKE